LAQGGKSRQRNNFDSKRMYKRPAGRITAWTTRLMHGATGVLLEHNLVSWYGLRGQVYHTQGGTA